VLKAGVHRRKVTESRSTSGSDWLVEGHQQKTRADDLDASGLKKPFEGEVFGGRILKVTGSKDS
jgi:hypothetical protein